MNNKQAIAVLKYMTVDMTCLLAGLSETNTMMDVLRQRLDALEIAQEVLQAQEVYPTVAVDDLPKLWEAYACEKDENMTEDAQEFARKLRTAIRTINDQQMSSGKTRTRLRYFAEQHPDKLADAVAAEDSPWCQNYADCIRYLDSDEYNDEVMRERCKACALGWLMEENDDL